MSVQEEHKQGNVVGLDISTGEALDPAMAGIFDNYLVKKQILQSAPVVASQLLLVDEVMRAGKRRQVPSMRIAGPVLRLVCSFATLPKQGWLLYGSCHTSAGSSVSNYL